jgi:hypothetical protein
VASWRNYFAVRSTTMPCVCAFVELYVTVKCIEMLSDA